MDDMVFFFAIIDGAYRIKLAGMVVLINYGRYEYMGMIVLGIDIFTLNLMFSSFNSRLYCTRIFDSNDILNVVIFKNQVLVFVSRQ